MTNLITAAAQGGNGVPATTTGAKHQGDVRQRHSDNVRPNAAMQAQQQQVQQAQQQQQKMILTATVKDAGIAVTPGTERLGGNAGPSANANGNGNGNLNAPKRHVSDFGVSATTMERAVREEREEFIRQEDENLRRVNEMTEYINNFSIGSSLFKCDLFMAGIGGESGSGSGGAGNKAEEGKKKKSFKDRLFGKFKGGKGKKEELSIVPTKSGIVMPPPGMNKGNGTTTGNSEDDDILAIAGIQGFALASK